MGALGIMDRVLSVTMAIAAIALSSCSRIAERAFAQPTIGVRSVKLKSVGLSGGSIEIALAIANPNPYPLPVQHAVYSFLLTDSTEIGRGESRCGIHTPRARLRRRATFPSTSRGRDFAPLRATRPAMAPSTTSSRARSRWRRRSATRTSRSKRVGRFTPPPSLVRSLN